MQKIMGGGGGLDVCRAHTHTQIYIYIYVPTYMCWDMGKQPTSYNISKSRLVLWSGHYLLVWSRGSLFNSHFKPVRMSMLLCYQIRVSAAQSLCT